ncbi:MAG: ABC transporter ATP-binding protein [Caldilineaceae bacterium]|nr:ABC transporter ATP-binding protein [Caldilineaceae bacterium]
MYWLRRWLWRRIYLFLHGQITIGTVYLVMAYLALRDRLERIRDQVSELQQNSASIQRIRQLLP